MPLPAAAGFPAPTPFAAPQPAPYFGITDQEKQLAAAVPGLTGLPTVIGGPTTTPFTQTQEQYGFLQSVTGGALGEGNDPRQWTAQDAAAQTDTALAKIGAVNPGLAQELAATRNPTQAPDTGDGFLNDVLHAAGTVLGLPVIKQVFDVLSRPAHIIPEILADEEHQGIWGNVTQALAGESDKGWGQVLDTYGLLQGDDVMSKVAHAAAAFAGDVATDPLTYLTLGGGAVGREAMATAGSKAFMKAKVFADPHAISALEKMGAQTGHTVEEVFEQWFTHSKGVGQLGGEGGSVLDDHINKILNMVHDDAKGGVLSHVLETEEVKSLGETLRVLDDSFTSLTTVGYKGITDDVAAKLGLDKEGATKALDEMIKQGRGFVSKGAYQQGKAAAAVFGQPRFNFGLMSPFGFRYAGKRILPFDLPFSDFAVGRRFFAGLSGEKRAMKMWGAGQLGANGEQFVRAFWEGGFRKAAATFPKEAEMLAGGSFLHMGSILYPASDLVGGLTAQLSSHAKVLRGGGLGSLAARDASNRARQMVEDVAAEIHKVVDPDTGRTLSTPEFNQAVIDGLGYKARTKPDPNTMARIVEYVNALPGGEARTAAYGGDIEKYFDGQLEEIDTALHSGQLDPQAMKEYQEARATLLKNKARARTAYDNLSPQERRVAHLFGEVMDSNAEARAKYGIQGDAYDPETVSYGASVHTEDVPEFQQGAHGSVAGKRMVRENELATDGERLTEEMAEDGDYGRGYVLRPDGDFDGTVPPTAAEPTDVNVPDWADPAKNPHAGDTQEVAIDELLPYKVFEGDLADYGDDAQAFVDDIAERGVQEPVILTYDPMTGNGYISDGAHRLTGAAEAGQTHVPVRVEITEHGIGGNVTPLDRAQYDADVLRGQQLAKKLGNQPRKGERGWVAPEMAEKNLDEAARRQVEQLPEVKALDERIPRIEADYDEKIAAAEIEVEKVNRAVQRAGETDATTGVRGALENELSRLKKNKQLDIDRVQLERTTFIENNIGAAKRDLQRPRGIVDEDERLAAQYELAELTGNAITSPAGVGPAVRRQRRLMLEGGEGAPARVYGANDLKGDALGGLDREARQRAVAPFIDKPVAGDQLAKQREALRHWAETGEWTGEGDLRTALFQGANATDILKSMNAGGAKPGAKLVNSNTGKPLGPPADRLRGAKVHPDTGDVVPPQTVRPDDLFAPQHVGRAAKPRHYVANVKNPATEATAREVREQVIQGLELTGYKPAVKKATAINPKLSTATKRQMHDEILDAERVSKATRDKLEELGHDGVAHEDGRVTVFSSDEARRVKRVSGNAPRSATKHGNVSHVLTRDVENAVGKQFGKDRAGAARLLTKISRDTIGKSIKDADIIMRRALRDAGVTLKPHQKVLEDDVLKVAQSAATHTGHAVADQFMGRVARRIEAFGWSKSGFAGDAVGINRFKYVVADGAVEAIARAGAEVQESAERAAGVQARTVGPLHAQVESIAKQMEDMRKTIQFEEDGALAVITTDDAAKALRLQEKATRTGVEFEKGTMEMKDALNEYNKARTRLHTASAKAEPALIARENAVNREGLENLAEFPGFEDTFLPTFMAEEMRRASRGYGGFTGFHKEYRKFMSWWKSWATYMFPGFHARNFQGAWFNNFLGGVDLGDHIFASRVRRAAHEVVHEKGGKWSTTKMVERDAAHIREMGLEKLYGKQVYDWTYADFAKVTSDMGVNAAHGRSFGEARVGAELLEQKAQQHFIEKSPFNARIGRPGEAYVKGMKGAGTMTENLFRTAAFVRGLKATGGDVSGARAFMMMRHGDYADLTDFEHGFVRDVLPFYKWMRTNTPLQIHQLLESPGKLLAVSKARGAAYDLQGQNYEEEKYKIPEWMRDTLTIPLGSGDAHNLVMMDLPMSDLFINGREFVSSFLPMVRPFIESYALEKTTFTGRELTGEAQPLDHNLSFLSPFLGAIGLANKGADGRDYVDDKTANILGALPFYSRFTNWLYEDETRVRGRANALASGMFGLGLRPVDETTLSSTELDFYYSQVVPAMDHMRSMGYQLPTKDDLEAALGTTDTVLNGLGITPGATQYAA